MLWKQISLQQADKRPMAGRTPETGGGQGKRTCRRTVTPASNRWFPRNQPPRRQHVTRGGRQSTSGVWQLVFAASHAQDVGRSIHRGMRGVPERGASIELDSGGRPMHCTNLCFCNVRSPRQLAAGSTAIPDAKGSGTVAI
jgi:hypothetical protein